MLFLLAVPVVTALLVAAPQQLHATCLRLKSVINLKSLLFTRPDTGPQVIVEIVGADLNHRANRFFDLWSRPDTYTVIHHGRTERQTQVEGNTNEPRFLFKTKMPYDQSNGMRFVVKEADALGGGAFIGRAYIEKDKVKELMDSEESALLSLGENIGVLKISVTRAPVEFHHEGVDVGPFTLKPEMKKLHEL